MDQVIDSVNNFGGLAFVRGFSEGMSHTESTAWVRGDCYPRHVVVVTRSPLFGNSMAALVDQWRGRAYLSIGLIFPEDRTPCYPQNGEYPQLTGKLWGWRSKSGEIYTKTFNSSGNKDLSRQVPIAKHDCTIAAGVELRISHNVKRKTIHFSINGRKQFVSTCNEELNICYGFVRLSCEDNDSEIQVTLAPTIYDEAPEELEVGSVETAPTNILRDFLISVGRKTHENFSWLLPGHAKCKVKQDLLAENQRLRPYKMNSECPGICLLINNLKDSARDENLLTELFSSLAFNVEVKRRLSMMEINEVAQEFAKRDHSGYDSFVFILLSQCGPGEPIVGVDGREVILKQVMSEFRPCRSASLKNKPKLFFVLKFVDFRTQSKKRRNGGTEFCTDVNIALPNSCNTSLQEVCPEEADFLLACATSPIFKGKKIKQAKLSFTEIMVNAVRGYHQTYHLLEMLTLLNHWTKKLREKSGQLNVMMPYVTHTLRHEVRFDSSQTDRPQVSALSYIPGSSSLSRYDGYDTKYRGYCVIINNLKFQENEEGYRKGAEQDDKRLENLFKSLRFRVIMKRNLEKNQIERVAQEYGGRNHDKFAAFFLIVMSHGDDRDCILGVDNRTTSVKALMREFQAERCPSLKGKPKILIIQTCRGSRQCDVERFDDFVGSINAELDLADNCVGPFSMDSSLSKSVFPTEADFLLAFATVPGYAAFRSEESGAFFIQELVEVIEKYHGSHHLLDMLTEVTRRVIDHPKREINSAAYRVQVPAPTHTLTKLLFL
ncbi:uncharacterized protein LOC141880775 [Acropora palmata]|uniref:uncharacterized protein LOC141880775 n=1 Tax=Acropora palmata TaxID=6131 RepID=UPI003DA10129